MTVMLAYNHEDEVPDKVQLWWMKFKTRPYIPLATSWYRSHGYGHVARYCYKPNDSWPACAGSHKFDACPTKDMKKCVNCKGYHGSGFMECPKYIEAKAIVRRAAKQNTSHHDVLVNMRKDEREEKKRAAALDQPAETASTNSAPGQTTLDDGTGPTISNNTDSTSQRPNISRSSIARIVQSKRTSIVIQVDIDDDCLKSVKRDGSSQERKKERNKERRNAFIVHQSSHQKISKLYKYQ